MGCVIISLTTENIIKPRWAACGSLHSGAQYSGDDELHDAVVPHINLMNNCYRHCFEKRYRMKKMCAKQTSVRASVKARISHRNTTPSLFSKLNFALDSVSVRFSGTARLSTRIVIHFKQVDLASSTSDAHQLNEGKSLGSGGG